MKRKVIQLAGSTFVVTLPSGWVREWSITKGDELDLEERGPQLWVTTQKVRQTRACSLNVSNVSDRVLRWQLSSLHKKGYDEIEVLSVNPSHSRTISELIKDLFLGFTVVQNSDVRYVIKAVSKDVDSEFDAMLRRAFLVTLQLADRCARVFKTNDEKLFEELFALEKSNNQLTNFCERVLNKRGVADMVKTNFLYVIIWNLEKVADEYKYMCEYVEKNKVSQLTLSILEKVNVVLRKYYELFYSYSERILDESASECLNLRKEIYQAMMTSKDNVVLAHCLNVVLRVADFSSSIFALQES